jgi:hypothetical protein
VETESAFIPIWKGGKMETDPVSKRLYSLEYQTVDKVQKLSNLSIIRHYQNPTESISMKVVLMKIQLFE